MASLNVDSVAFSGVLKNYPPGEKLEVAYALNDDLTPASRDWVGLFRVGWSSSRDYYTFEWAPAPTDKKGSVVFAGRRLPPQDKHFYQFCYVSSDGRVRGASSPFQFSSTATLDHVEDMELVEVSEDSLMVIQAKETSEAQQKNAGLEKELVSVKESVVKLESEKESLIAKFELVELDGAKKSEKLVELEGKVADFEEKEADLGRQLQAKRESETRLMEKLEKERALVHELTTARSNEEAQMSILRQKLQESEAALSASQRALDASKAENAVLARQYEEGEGKLAQQASEINQLQELVAKQASEMGQLQEMQVELMTQIGDKNQEFEEQMARFEMLRRTYEEETQALRTEKEQLLQDATIAQQNVAELLGAQEEGVPVDMIQVNQEPPTLPATQVNMVDKSAYEALQQAYEDIEDRYHKTREDNKEWRTRYIDIRNKNAELEERIRQCKVQYEARCIELREARKNGGVVGGGSLTDVAALQNRLRDMEENQQQITVSWDVATKELATRKEELKQKEASIAELEEKLLGVVQSKESVREEFRVFQDKHDKVVNEKAAKMDQLQAHLQQKTLEVSELHAAVRRQDGEKTKLENTVRQLREQLETLKQQVHSAERSCPVCNTKFPGRISQQDFEKHVQGHFNGV